MDRTLIEMMIFILLIIIILIMTLKIIPDIYYKHSKNAKIIIDYYNNIDKDELIKCCIESTIFNDYKDGLNTFTSFELCKIYIIVYNKMDKDGFNINYKQVENVLSRIIYKDKYILNTLYELYKYRKRNKNKR